MALKTIHFVPGLSGTPLLFIPRYLTNIFFKNILQKKRNLENRTSGNLEIQKPRFTNRSPVIGLTSAGGMTRLYAGLGPKFVRVIVKRYRRNSIHTNFSRRISWEWFWILFLRRILEKGNFPKFPPHPTPAFPFNVMAFPFTGRSHLLGVPI